MRVLFVNPSAPPVPYGTGLQVHNWGNIQALQLLGHEVYLVMLTRHGENRSTKVKEASDAIKGLKMCTTIEVPKQPIRSLSSLTPSLIIKELIEPITLKGSFFVQNHEKVCLEIEKLLHDINAELIWYEDFYVAIFDNWIKRKIPAVYNSHDNQARLYKQKNLNGFCYSKRIGSKIRRTIYNNRHKALEKSEFKTQKRCDIMFTGNIEDSELSKSHGVNAISRRVPIIGPSEKLLNERNNRLNNDKIQKNKIKLLHLGALHGSFTSKSLLWFLDEVWQNLLKELKDIDIELHIIGSGKPSKELLKKFDQPNIVFRGYVEDLWEEFVDTFAMIIPGQVSTGIRIRLPVAYSMMVPVIGNQVSFHGMPDAKDGEIVLYAETVEEYAVAVRKLMDNASFYKSMCQNVRRVYDDNFSLKAASMDIQRAISMLP